MLTPIIVDRRDLGQLELLIDWDNGRQVYVDTPELAKMLDSSSVFHLMDYGILPKLLVYHGITLKAA